MLKTIYSYSNDELDEADHQNKLDKEERQMPTFKQVKRQIQIRIDTGSKAFGDDEREESLELWRILQKLAQEIKESGSVKRQLLFDINGNLTGRIGFEYKP